jgi:formamidopyrimidine-DNA glycosylase
LLEGARALAARRRAKLLLLDLEAADGSPLLMAFHLKMTGSLLVRPAQSAPGRHSRLYAAHSSHRFPSKFSIKAISSTLNF